MTTVSFWWSQTNFTVVADVVATVPDNTTITTTTVASPVKWGAVALVLIVIATAFGNILLCVAVMSDRRLQNMTNYFLASLAVSDLLVAVVVMPLAVVVQIYGNVRLLFRFTWTHSGHTLSTGV